MSNERHSLFSTTHSTPFDTRITCEQPRRATSEKVDEERKEKERQQKEAQLERRRKRDRELRKNAREANEPERKEKARQQEKAWQQELKMDREKMARGEAALALRKQANDLRWMIKVGADPEKIQQSQKTLEAARTENRKKRRRIHGLKSRDKKRQKKGEGEMAIGEAGEGSGEMV
jgi:colicin import membrane protein